MMRRVISLALIVLTLTMLVFSLSSCSEEAKYEKLVSGATEEQKTDFVAKIIAENNTTKIRFLAASRGHDITADGFEDTDTVKENADVTAAKKVMDDILKGS